MDCNIVDNILCILKSNGIRKKEDLVIKSKDGIISYRTAAAPSADNNPWVEQIYELVRSNMVTNRQRLAGEKKYIVSDITDNETLKYMCFFPSSSIVLTDKFKYEGSHKQNDYYSLPVEYLYKLLDNAELIRNNVFSLIPERVEYALYPDDYHYLIDTIGGEYREGVRSPPKNIMGKNGIYLERNNIQKLYYFFPWLYGAKIEDYLEIVDKNELHFKNYNILLNKLSNKMFSGDICDILYDINQAHINMQIEFEKSQDNLRKRGISAAVSIGCTFIPLALNVPDEIKTNLISVLGTVSIKELLSTFYSDISNLKGVGKSNPFYLTWQWQRLSS